MFTYKFFVHASGRLWLRLRNNNRKVELSMDFETTNDELIVATSTPKGMRSQLGRIVSANSAILNMIADKLAREGRRDEDVRKIRDMFLEYIGRKSARNRHILSLIGSGGLPGQRIIEGQEACMNTQ